MDDQGHGIETAHGDHLIIEENKIGPNIGTKGVEPYQTDCGVLRNNFITNSGDHGIALTANHWDVYNNVVDMEPPFAHDPVYAMKISGGQNNDVWNNIFYTTNPTLPSPLNDRPQGLGIFDRPNIRAYNNTIFNFANTYNGGQYGTCISIGSENNASASYEDVQNNLTYNCRNESNIQFWMYNGTQFNNIAYNNFFYQNASDLVMEVDPGFSTVASFNGSSLPNGSKAANNTQITPSTATPLMATLPIG
jgi:hypothetical protein